MYLYYFIGMYITTMFLYSDSFLYRYLAYICEGIFALHMYIPVASPYPPGQGITILYLTFNELLIIN